MQNTHWQVHMATEAKSSVPFLHLQGVNAFYGESHILHGVDLVVNQGELVTLLGRNGAGRTTTIKSILGLVGQRSGSIQILGQETSNWATHDIARLGVGYCPEERGIFASLSCEENLLLPPVIAPGAMTLEEIYALFPNLYERRHSPGTRLSGGEQQMLAISRALMLRPRLLLLDEPSFGLAPLIVKEIFEIMRQINQEDQVSMLLVEQNASLALNLADHAYLLETGKVVLSGPAADIKADESIRRVYLGY